jgi:hypothetical protein
MGEREKARTYFYAPVVNPGEIIESLSPRKRGERAGVRGDKIRHHIYEIVY